MKDDFEEITMESVEDDIRFISSRYNFTPKEVKRIWTAGWISASNLNDSIKEKVDSVKNPYGELFSAIIKGKEVPDYDECVECLGQRQR